MTEVVVTVADVDGAEVTAGAETGAGVVAGAIGVITGAGVGVEVGTTTGVGSVTLTVALAEAPEQLTEYVVFVVGATLTLPDVAFPVEKFVPTQLEALALDHVTVDELPLTTEVGLAEIVAVATGAGGGTTTAGTETVLPSRVTAVWARARPLSLAPVCKTIAV